MHTHRNSTSKPAGNYEQRSNPHLVVKLMTNDSQQQPDEFEKSLGNQATGADVSRVDRNMSLGDQSTTGDALSSLSDLGSDPGKPIDSDLPLIDLSTRYEIEEELGQGGMGAVLLATDRQLKRKVAIKRILGSMAQSKTALQRFITEAQSIASLNHSNIVQVYEFGRDAEGPLLVLEYVDGGSLLDKLKNGKLEVEEAVDITCQLCDGLSVTHNHGIVHRDIKPANLLLTTAGDAKLLDFGIAKLYGSNNLTADHAIVGTADYMAPEQAEGARPSAKSDLFSLSSSMYAALCGNPPFSAPNVPAIMHKLRFEAPVRIGKRVDDLPVDVDHLIHSGLVKDPAKRIPTAMAMMHQMQAILDGFEQLMPRQTPGIELLISDPTTEVIPEASPDHSKSLDDQTVAGDYDSPPEQINETIITSARPTTSRTGESERRTHYTEVDADASLESESVDDGKAGAVLAIILLLIMVSGLAYGVWYQMRPLDANELITEIETTSNQNEKLRLMSEFISRFPEHEEAATIDSVFHRLKAQDELQRFRKRVLNSKITTGLSANELRIREIWNSEDTTEKRIGSLLGFTLMGESGSLIPLLAQQLIDELEAEQEQRRSQIKTQISDQIKQLQTMLKTDPEKAQQVISGLIKAYGDLPWLGDEMSTLREMEEE